MIAWHDLMSSTGRRIRISIEKQLEYYYEIEMILTDRVDRPLSAGKSDRSPAIKPTGLSAAQLRAQADRMPGKHSGPHRCTFLDPFMGNIILITKYL